MSRSNSCSGSVISSVTSLSSSLGHKAFDRPESRGPFVKRDSFLYVALRISVSSNFSDFCGLVWLVFISVFLYSLTEEVNNSMWEGISFDLIELFPCLLDLVLYILE